jgi:hypothetical protein
MGLWGYGVMGYGLWVMGLWGYGVMGYGLWGYGVMGWGCLTCIDSYRYPVSRLHLMILVGMYPKWNPPLPLSTALPELCPASSGSSGGTSFFFVASPTRTQDGATRQAARQSFCGPDCIGQYSSCHGCVQCRKCTQALARFARHAASVFMVQ